MKRALTLWPAVGLLIACAASAHAVATDTYLGDVDGDGKVTIRDAVLVLRKSVGLSPINPHDLLVGDLTPTYGVGKLPIGNGTLKPSDAVTIMSMALGRSIALQAASPMTIALVAGDPNARSGNDTTPGRVKFSAPSAVTEDAVGNMYVVDRGNHAIREVTTAGDVMTFAGSGASGLTDGTGTLAQFSQPISIAMSPYGDLYVIDSNRLRRIGPDGTVVTIVGGSTTSTGSTTSGTGGTTAGGTTAGTTTGSTTTTTNSFTDARGIAVDSLGYIYVADAGTNSSNGRIWRVDPSSGSMESVTSPGLLVNPTAVTVDDNGYLYVVDSGANRIRRIDPDGSMITLAGIPQPGNQDGSGLTAQFNTPQAIAIDSSGNLYVSDVNNHSIRLILPNGSVTTIAGGKAGYNKNDKLAVGASIGVVRGLAVDSSGNVLLADETNNIIRRLTTQ